MRNCTCWLEIETCNCEEDEDYTKMRRSDRVEVEINGVKLYYSQKELNALLEWNARRG